MLFRARPQTSDRRFSTLVATCALGSSALLLADALPALAQSAGQSALPGGSPEAVAKKRWGLLLNSNLSSSLHAFNDPNHSASADLWIMPSYALSSKWRLTGVLVVGKDLTGERLTTLSRTDLGAAWAGTPLNPFLRLTAATGVRLPFATHARDRQSLVSALKFSPRLLLNLEPAGLSSVSAFYESSVLLNFHEFQTATTGRPNTQVSWTQSVSGTWAPGEKFSSTTSFGWINAWTYGGFRSNSFSLDQQFSWQFNPTVGVSLGIGNSGSPLKPNGTESAISLIDPENSQAYCSLSLSL